MGSKKLFVILLVVAIVLVALSLTSFVLLKDKSRHGTSQYSAVYLETGDLYFGKLHWFPKHSLTDAWYLDRRTDSSGQSGLGILSFDSVFWEPAGTIILNPDKVVWYAPLGKDSKLATALDNPDLLRNNLQVPNGGTQGPGTDGPPTGVDEE